MFSCNTADIERSGKEFIPLSSGNKWVYEYNNERNSKTYSTEVKSIKSAGGSFIEAVFDSFEYLGFYDQKRIILKSDGSYEVKYTDGGNFQFIPPADKQKKDFKWTSREWNCRVISDSESVTVGGKTYSDCVHLGYVMSITFSAQLWVKPGVGIVKWFFNRTNPPTLEFGEFELKDHTLK
jgi:hypothetical protein